jgi:hypothetical protein
MGVRIGRDRHIHLTPAVYSTQPTYVDDIQTGRLDITLHHLVCLHNSNSAKDQLQWVGKQIGMVPLWDCVFEKHLALLALIMWCGAWQYVCLESK